MVKYKLQVVCVGAFSLNLKLKIIPSLVVINIVPKPTGLRVFYKKNIKYYMHRVHIRVGPLGYQNGLRKENSLD